MKSALVLFALLLPLPAAAATIEFVTSVRPNYNGGGGGCNPDPAMPSCRENNDYAGWIEVPPFDPELGTLLQADVALDVWTGPFETTYVDNWGIDADPGTTEVELEIELLLHLDGAVFADTLPIAAITGSQALPECQAPCTLPGWNLSTSATASLVGADAAPFIGTEPILFSYEIDQNSSGSIYYYWGVPSSEHWTTSLRTTYTYVPEPGTGLLMALGVAVAVRGRRRR